MDKRKTRWGLCVALGLLYSIPAMLYISEFIEHGWDFVKGMGVVLMLIIMIGSCAPVGSCGCR